MQQWQWGLGWLVMLVAWAILGLAPVRAQGATLDQALDQAPQGIKLDGVFTPGQAQGNVSRVKETANPLTQAVVVTDDVNQFGAIWSTEANYFDLTRDQQVSMWMYFDQDRDGYRVANGMAFVLQNDPAGLQAKPKFPGNRTSGETLGVWGVDFDRWNSSAQNIADSAIQRSWALEFDTFVNGSEQPGVAGSFDHDLAAAHIAVNYPAQASSYTMVLNRKWIFEKNYYAKMQHRGLIQAANSGQPLLADGQWHHVTLQWDAQKSQMTYSYNDKQPDRDASDQSQLVKAERRTVTIDQRIIDPQHTGKVRWGFTGATGAHAANNLVVFENVPDLVNSTATATLTNRTRGTVIQDGDRIRSGEQVELDYQLTYLGGKQAWERLEGKLHLPEHLDFTTGTVTDGTGKRTPLTADQLHGHQPLSLGTLTQHQPIAHLTLRGTVRDVATVTDVAPHLSVFQSANGVGVATANTPGFKVYPHQELVVDLPQKAYTLYPEETTTILGRLHLKDGGPVVAHDDVWLYPVLNGRTLPRVPIRDGQIQWTPDPHQLKWGQNRVTLSARDAGGNVSPPVTVTITVVGTLTFETVSKRGSFQATRLMGHTQRVWHTNDWQLRVLDTRRSARPWQLQATATPLVDPQRVALAGQVIYRQGATERVLNQAPTVIYQGITTGDPVTDITQRWTATSGVGLQLGGAALAGTYHTTITWQLMDTPS